MQINWKLRLKNKATVAALLAAVVVFAYSAASALGVTLPMDQQQVTDGIAAVLAVLTAAGVLVDPTTAGMSDSPDVLEYDKPRADGNDLPDEADEVAFDEDAEG